MEYIVKNCPALSHGKGLRFKKCYRTNWKEYCKDCSDCLLKRIVEIFKNFRKDNIVINGNQIFVEEILNLLEIEEVNE